MSEGMQLTLLAMIVALLIGGGVRQALAGDKPLPVPVSSTGTCPAGYSRSGNYCAPHPNTRERAIPKPGLAPCPVGTHASGDFCLQERR